MPAAPRAQRPDPQALLGSLRDHLKRLESVLVCYSGGIDSAFVLAVANEELGNRAIGMTAVSPSLPPSEKQEAARIARNLGAEHRFVDSHEIEKPDYRKNGADRCFHCKTELYDIAAVKQREWGAQAIVNGTNTDDLGDYRPGLEAAKRAGVQSPLVDLGFSKEDVRAAAKLIGMEIWDKPASACLSSRIPYGTEVTPERLQQIGDLEADLRGMGLRQVRVRWHDKIARIEVPLADLPRLLEEENRERIVRAGRERGFLYVTLDLAGYRTGSLNEALGKRKLRLV